MALSGFFFFNVHLWIFTYIFSLGDEVSPEQEVTG